MARAAAVIVQDGAVALIERVRGDARFYLFPGGQVERDESSAEAARREVREELGVSMEVRKLLAEVLYKENVQYYFLADIVGGVFGTGQGPELSESRPVEAGGFRPVWMPVSELPHQPVYPACVVEVVTNAECQGWPDEPLQLIDHGRAWIA